MNQFLCSVRSKSYFQFNSIDDREYLKNVCLLKISIYCFAFYFCLIWRISLLIRAFIFIKFRNIRYNELQLSISLDARDGFTQPIFYKRFDRFWL